jgi:hypothetical protein
VTSWLEAVVPAELRTRLAGVTAEVRITRVERRFHAAIRVTHGAYSGEREVDGRRCEEVARSAIVVVSVSLSEAVEQAETPPPPPVPDPEEDVPPPVEPTVAPTVVVPADVPPPISDPPAPPALPTLLLDIGAGATFGVGNAPLAARVELGAQRPITRGFTIGGRLRAVPRTQFRDDDAPATLSLVLVGVEACGRHALSTMLHLTGCARLDAGALRAEGRDGTGQPARGRAPFVAAALTPAIEIGTRFRLRIAPEIEARVVRPRLTMQAGEETSTLYRIPTFGGSIDLGLVILIP